MSSGPSVVALFLGLVLLAVPARAAETGNGSLFFTSDETRAIEEAVRRAPPTRAGNAAGVVHVGAILYYGPERWTVWLQGERWTPATRRDGLAILAVNAESVRLSVTPAPGTPPATVTLRPWQSWNFLTGKVTNGR